MTSRKPTPMDPVLNADPALNAALRRAVRLLKHRDRTRAELTQRLAAAGVDPTVIARVLRKLGSLADDERTARVAADQLRSKGPIATPMVRALIESRGVPEPIAAVVSGDGTNDPAAARELAAKAASRLSGVDAATRWRRVLGALARKGFDEDTSLEAAVRVLGPPPEVDAPASPPDRRRSRRGSKPVD